MNPACLFGPVLRYGAFSSLRKLLVAASLALVSLDGATATAAPVTLAALGDSLTQGYGLPTEDGLVPQLQRWLAANGSDAVVLNAGLSGDTTAGGLSRLDWTLTPDVDALIVALGGNDLLRGIPPEESRANLDAILAKAQERGLPVLLAGLDAPGNYGPEYKTAFDAIYPELATKYGALLVPNLLAPLQTDPDREHVMTTLMQPDRLHPNAEGVGRIVSSLGPVVLELLQKAE
ncbi:MAG: arylesterase [Rhodobacteraceae bacterium]|nr:arylesterase [Paracoccaceae bacterium]